MSGQVNGKVEAWSKKVFRVALDELRNFFLVNVYNGNRFHPYVYFEKAVDNMAFPDYYQIITNPVDLHLIQRRINGYFSVNNHLDSAYQRILSDVDLMRDNAHTYNVGDANIEVRICADAVRNYFRFVLRSALKVMKHYGDSNLADALFSSSFLNEFLEEVETEDVLRFLTQSQRDLAVLFEEQKVIKDAGVKQVTAEVRSRLQDLLLHSLIAGRSSEGDAPKTTTATGKKKGSVTAKKSASSAPPAAVPVPATTAASSSSSSRRTSSSGRGASRPAASAAAVDDPWGSDPEDSTPLSPAPSSKSTKANNNRKRSRASADDKDEVHAFDLSDGEEDPFASLSIPVASRKSSSSSAAPANKRARSSGVAAAAASVAIPLLPPQTAYIVEEEDPALLMTHPAPPSWQEGAETVYKYISKHPYVDIFTSKQVIANFFVPVIDQSPHLAEAYLARIPHPMDLSLVHDRLFVDQDFASALDFADTILLVFRNAVDFNAASDAGEHEFTRDLVDKSRHLMTIVEDLCLEHLPLGEDQNMSEEEAEKTFGWLRVSRRERRRKEREQKVAQASLHELSIAGINPYSDCKKLLKDIERGRSVEEKKQLAFFIFPVDTALVIDYAMYVRQPMDLSTLKYKLDGTMSIDPQVKRLINPHTPRYALYGEFIADLRRIFDNAQRYNKQHLEDDTTGISRLVYEAAVVFAEKVEQLLPKFTVILSDRVYSARVVNAKTEKEREENLKRQREEEAAKEALRSKVLEELKRSNTDLAVELAERERQRLRSEREESVLRAAVSEREILERNLQEQLLLQQQQQQQQQQGEMSLSPDRGELSPSLSPSTTTLLPSNVPNTSTTAAAATGSGSDFRLGTTSSSMTMTAGVVTAPRPVIVQLSGLGPDGHLSTLLLHRLAVLHGGNHANSSASATMTSDLPMKKLLSRKKARQLFSTDLKHDPVNPSAGHSTSTAKSASASASSSSHTSSHTPSSGGSKTQPVHISPALTTAPPPPPPAPVVQTTGATVASSGSGETERKETETAMDVV